MRPASRGFTLVEVVVAMVLTTVVGLGFAGATRYTTRVVARSGAELRATEFLRSEVARLRSVEVGALADGARVVGSARSSWTERDEGGIRRVQLVTRVGDAASGDVVDTVVVTRRP